MFTQASALMKPLPHLSSNSRVGFEAMVSFICLPVATGASIRPSTAASMSR